MIVSPSSTSDKEAFEAKVAKLSDAWNIVEARLKAVELFRNHTPIFPAINELRYAGRKIVDASNYYKNRDTKNSYKCLQDAENYINNARNDIVDGVVTFCGLNFIALRNEVGKRYAVQYFSNFNELSDLLKSCYDKIIQSRKDRSKRNAIYDELSKHTDRLQNLWWEFDKSIPTILLKKKAESWFNRYNVGLGIIAVLGLALAITSLVFK